MAKNNKMPAIRFSGYTDAWEQRKFSDITYLSGIKNKENKPYESYSISNEFGFIPQDEQFENGGTMKTADKSMYYIVSQNSFAYNPARINVGSIGYYNKPDNVIVSSLYEVFKTTDIVSDKFLWHWFKSNQFNRLIEKYQEGGVRLYFYYDKLCKGTIDLPTINEQNKISNLLDDLDMYITLHQRKLEKLKLTKKALLQKLFPKNGSNIPELRFKGFTNAWEQRKLNDLVTIRRGLTYKPSDIAENGIRVLRSSNIDEDQFITSNDDVFVNIEAVNIPFAKNGDILITSANGSNRLVGKHTIIRDIADNSAVHGGFMLLAESNNPLFTDALLSSNWYKRFINTYVAGGNGAIGNLSKSDLESQIVMVPSEHEQAKIGQWYDNINQLITLHQRKLEMLKNVKKGLLQKMFV